MKHKGREVLLDPTHSTLVKTTLDWSNVVVALVRESGHLLSPMPTPTFRLGDNYASGMYKTGPRFMKNVKFSLKVNKYL